MDIFTMKSGAIADTKEKFNKRQKEIKNFLAEAVYGRIPEPPEHLGADIISEDRSFGGGIGILRCFMLKITLDGELLTLPFKSVVPSENGKHPTFIYIGDDGAIPGKHLPAEEIVERGYGIFCLALNDVFPDEEKETRLIKKLVPSRRKKDSPGRIALLAWLIMRVTDYAAHQSYVDEKSLAVIGHGLLARAALVAGGYDERFKYIVLNSLEFGEKYLSSQELFAKGFFDNADACFDELALALCVPRTLIVGAALDDVVSDQEGEMSALAALQGAYNLFDKNGLAQKEPLTSEITVESDSIFYRLRSGVPYLCRRDWNAYMNYIDADLAKNTV